MDDIFQPNSMIHDIMDYSRPLWYFPKGSLTSQDFSISQTTRIVHLHLAVSLSITLSFSFVSLRKHFYWFMRVRFMTKDGSLSDLNYPIKCDTAKGHKSAEANREKLVSMWWLYTSDIRQWSFCSTQQSQSSINECIVRIVQHRSIK